jgi:hypothetical protein
LYLSKQKKQQSVANINVSQGGMWSSLTVVGGSLGIPSIKLIFRIVLKYCSNGMKTTTNDKILTIYSTHVNVKQVYERPWYLDSFCIVSLLITLCLDVDTFSKLEVIWILKRRTVQIQLKLKIRQYELQHNNWLVEILNGDQTSAHILYYPILMAMKPPLISNIILSYLP